MEKFLFRGLLLGMILMSGSSMAQTYQSCTEGGGCNTYNTGGSGSGSLGLGGRGTAPTPGGIGIKVGPDRRMQDTITKNCVAEKNRIEEAYSNCRYRTSNDKLRETTRCNVYSNREASFGIGLQHKVIVADVTYTIQNPTYDKCINQVNAASEAVMEYCGVIYTRDQNAARTVNNGICSKHFQ